jgi:hypothetical protein
VHIRIAGIQSFFRDYNNLSAKVLSEKVGVYIAWLPSEGLGLGISADHFTQYNRKEGAH